MDLEWDEGSLVRTFLGVKLSGLKVIETQATIQLIIDIPQRIHIFIVWICSSNWTFLSFKINKNPIKNCDN